MADKIKISLSGVEEYVYTKVSLNKINLMYQAFKHNSSKCATAIVAIIN